MKQRDLKVFSDPGGRGGVLVRGDRIEVFRFVAGRKTGVIGLLSDDGVCWGVGSDVVDRGDEPVSLARDGFDEAGIIGGVAEDLSEPHNRGIGAVVEVDEGVWLPESMTQLFAADDLSGTFDEHS